jgi:hypothetical protein
MRVPPTAHVALGVVYLSLSSPAFAYLDAATGSMILQAIIGGAATIMVFGRNYLAKMKGLFARKGPRK